MTTPTQHLSDADLEFMERTVRTARFCCEGLTTEDQVRLVADLRKARELLRRCRDGIAWVAADELGHELAAFLGVERGAEKG